MAAAARLVTGVLAPAATLAVVVAGLRTQVPGGLPAVVVVAFVLTLVWAVVAVVSARQQKAGAGRAVAGGRRRAGRRRSP